MSDPKQYFSEPHNLPEDDTVYIFNTLMSKLENFRMSTYRRVFDIHWLSLFWRGFLFFFFLMLSTSSSTEITTLKHFYSSSIKVIFNRRLTVLLATLRSDNRRSGALKGKQRIA